ncbi:NADH/Ubiquinone/plastoquinone (complex I) [Cellulomonas flavigena DSM 20109]|uniref:NADH/Ubiquinone/plastoquinone (Complex I) n=1 Tax=Cellulomonas flavigena (strain ATCC 482 / DSM 20109 / BCRC 11376 / JCM 18109 / NBRC 3775 / NCIMB 8073 / NRS 134) TaxID=446466 RepID=D5UGE4_CELFN|nr:Na+/H+ antiporter subunit A [Cellulomonas flavigena]ADG73127.1 NADH/Ubiquinone/plastoquinone (complex I) [Cellulomonas flavigena DSM 20109]
MLLLLILHLAAALVAPLLFTWLGRRAFWTLALAPASAAVWALTQTAEVQAGDGPVQVVEWIPALGIELSFRLDTLSWLMTVVVGGVGALVLVYCAAYFSPTASGLGRFGGVFTAFAGSMLGLVTADDLLLMFMFWELTTVTSYLLIGHYADRKASRRAAMQAIIVTTAGGLAMLVGVVILGHAAGTYSMSALVTDPPAASPAIIAAVACLLAGAATKSALIPFHFWLPAAMAAPTPVSAYLHAAAMVKAGVYLVARFAPAFAELPVWRWTVVVLGGGTLLLGGYRALRQHDLKLVLAFGTVSQLGLIILLVGLGTQATALAGLAMLGAHAMFKAALFLVVGTVDVACGTRDLRRLSGVGRALPWTALAGGLATASMIGLPPFAGYVAKEAGLEALVHLEDGTIGTVVLTVVVLGSALTVAYGLRFWWGAFATKPALVPQSQTQDEQGVATTTSLAAGGDESVEPAPVSRPSFLLTAPALVLAFLGVAVALLPQLGEHLLAPYAATYPLGEPGHLVLWGGFGLVLWLTVGVLGVGGLLFLVRDRAERWQARAPHVFEADLTYRRSMRKLDDVAADVTAVTQRGSLPLYLGVILFTWVAAVGTALLAGTSLQVETRPWDYAAQTIFAAAAIVAAILVARARRRLKAVILAGISGYATAGMFLLYGAPDLAVTQVLVETITLVVFVLVLRRLPPYFSDRPLAGSRWLRLGLGLAVGLTVAGVALVAPSARVHAPVSTDFATEAYEFGGGKNIVNVTLVDIRAWDTMGELSVLLVAATGVASLVFLSARGGRIFREREAPADRAVWGGTPDPMAALRRPGTAPGTTAPTGAQAIDGGAPATPSRGTGRAVGSRAREWLRAGRTVAPQRRSVIFEVVVRLLFHTMIVYSAFLLFSGHNQPGGGFAAGLVTGIALAVRYLAGGRYELGEAAPVQPGVLLGMGLFLSAGVGLAALFVGGNVLESWILEFRLPVWGDVKLVTSLFFDVGVYLVVVGLVLDILRSVGAEIDRRAETGEDEVAEHAVSGYDHVVVARGSGSTGEGTAP